ncbi:MAG TPA: hypothetical protein VFA38_06295 [Nitrospirales bacterium]|nr:hypothetical protein [Nitrospirales bacterium]
MKSVGRLPNVRLIICSCLLLVTSAAAMAQSDQTTIFAVVTKVPKDRRQVTAQVAASATTTSIAEFVLIPSDMVLENPIWRKLEVCHSLRAEAWKTADGYRLAGVKILDAGMLPMALQGIAGDCLLKKALEFNPQID